MTRLSFSIFALIITSASFNHVAHAEKGGVALSELSTQSIAEKAKADEAKAKAKKAKKTHHVLQLVQGENTLYVRKDSAGFFSASVSNRTFATVNQGWATLRAGKSIKSKLFAKASCPKQKSYCSIKIFVNGEGSLVYGNLYRVFGYENLAVRQVFKIDEDLKVKVPTAITNVEPKAKKAKGKAKAGT